MIWSESRMGNEEKEETTMDEVKVPEVNWKEAAEKLMRDQVADEIKRIERYVIGRRMTREERERARQNLVAEMMTESEE